MIRNLRQIGDDRTKYEQAIADVKPEIVKKLASSKQFHHQTTMITGFSDQMDVVSNSKATSFSVDYIFKISRDGKSLPSL